MAKTVRQLAPQDLQRFDPTRNLTKILDSARWEAAWEKLPDLLTVLREEYGAERIVVFGSLATKENFTRWSDIDLAVWGIDPDRFYQAVATLNELSPDIKVDLVDPERCQSIALRQAIQEEGNAV